jgi:galactose oxidase
VVTTSGVGLERHGRDPAAWKGPLPYANQPLGTTRTDPCNKMAGRSQPYWLTTTGTGSWTKGPARIYTGPRDRASAAMYRPGKILLCGGGNNPSTNAVEVIDLTAVSPQWRLINPMRHARNFHNATILADGTVLVTGGGAGPNDASVAVQETELWNPDTERWTLMAPLSGHRLYHSAAILLPDSRVLCAGGGRPPSKGGTDRKNAQIFSPPYLFKAGVARPTITSAPTGRIAYGATFTVGTPDAASIGAVNLIKHGSVTHSFDMGQRFYAVPRGDIVPISGGLQLKAPPNGQVATPGHYLLFILKDGVPSIARSVRIG